MAHLLCTGRLDLQQADESLALAWENCSAAREELGEQRTEVRRAVALGRCLLDPLAVLASLCGESLLQCTDAEPGMKNLRILQ